MDYSSLSYIVIVHHDYCDYSSTESITDYEMLDPDPDPDFGHDS